MYYNSIRFILLTILNLIFYSSHQFFRLVRSISLLLPNNHHKFIIAVIDIGSQSTKLSDKKTFPTAMSANQLFASYVEGKFRVQWQFRTNEHDLQSYDRIEVREKFDGGEDITCAVQVTQSSLASDSLIIRPVAPLNMADGQYYAVYISSTTEKEILKSNFFIAHILATSSFEDDFLVDKDDCNIDIVQIHAINVPGKENCEIDIEWKFKEDTGDLLSKNDYICIVPSKKVDDLKNVYHDHAYALASGRPHGKVSIQLGGYVKTGHEYQVFYLLNHHMKGVIRKGASDPFLIEDSMVPYFDNPAATKAASQQFNISTIMQYVMHEQMEKLKKQTAYNPLLTVVPKKDIWSIKIERGENEYKAAEDEVDIHLESVRKNDAAKNYYAETDDFINESKLVKQLTATLHEKPLFVFAGAEISVEAPSFIPSWENMMKAVLDETWNAIPKELQSAAEKIRATHSRRRPEEIMETYHFVLQSKLFDLFKLYAKGKPNTNHKALARIAKDGKIKAILTTNFDEFIEQALSEQGIPFKMVCTQKEFQDYYENGCNELAVLKIHGTVSKPETIIKMAMQFKVSGGFEGYKTKIAQNLIANYPTLVMGCTGWNFSHPNYQDFWGGVGRRGGEKIYYMRLKGTAGGPLLSKLIGRHVGDRLIIGEGSLPYTAITLWERFDSHASKSLVKFHNQVVSMDDEDATMKQTEYIRFWVSQLPKYYLTAILWNESIYLNEAMKLRIEKIRNRRMASDIGETIMSVATTDGVTAHLMDLALKFSQGIITNEVYIEKQRQATIELSLAPLAIPRKKKLKLIKLCAEAFKTHPLLIGSHDYQSMLPSYVLSVADVADDKITPIEYVNEAIDYIVEVLEPLSKKKHKDREAQIMYDLYHTQANVLRVPERKRPEVHQLFRNFTENAINNDLSEEDIRIQIQDVIIPEVNRIAFNQIDTNKIIETIVKDALLMDDGAEDNTEQVIECAHLLALGLHKQATSSINNLYKMQDVQKLLQIFNLDINKKIPDSHFEVIETKLNERTQPIIDLMKVIMKRKKRNFVIAPEEVISTFDIANAELLRLFLKNSSTLINDEARRETCGYYPRDSLPPVVATYLSRKVLKAFKSIKDERVIQTCLGMLCSLAEGSNDMKQMKMAVDKSLDITQDKITEATPYPIPEALAVQYQDRNDFETALSYYTIALEGYRNFASREKLDAVILNACLVQGKFNVKKALKMAFEHCPFFCEDVQTNNMVGPSRAILVQQCVAWAKTLGMSLDDAKVKIMRSNAQDIVDGRATVDRADDTDSCTSDERSNGNVKSKNASRSKSVVIEEPEIKKKKKKKVTKTSVVKGLPAKHDTCRAGKTRKAIKGEKACENCTIM